MWFQNESDLIDLVCPSGLPVIFLFSQRPFNFEWIVIVFAISPEPVLLFLKPIKL